MHVKKDVPATSYNESRVTIKGFEKWNSTKKSILPSLEDSRRAAGYVKGWGKYLRLRLSCSGPSLVGRRPIAGKKE